MTRKSISVTGLTYQRVKGYCADTRVSIAGFVDSAILEALGAESAGVAKPEHATAARDTGGVRLVALKVVDEQSTIAFRAFVTRKVWREIQDARCYYFATLGRHNFQTGQHKRCRGCEVTR